MKLLNWLILPLIFVLPVNLWASQGSSGRNLQILETQGSFDTFAIGSFLQDRACLGQVTENGYMSESGSAVIFADEAGQIQEIVVIGTGIFTQRYVSIGQSTMRDVLQRYGTANVSTLRNFVLLSYPNVVFVFDKVTSDKSDPLLQKVRFITLRPTPSTAQTTTDTSTIVPRLDRIITYGNFIHCNVCLWNHVYHPSRLHVLQDCISVTGTILDATNGRLPDGVRHEPDGDAHGWLQVDSQFQNLLNTANVATQGGNLVFEIICRYPVRQIDAVVSCRGYSDQVTLPPVGSHVRIVGTYVQDIRNQWMEIHPVTSITVIPF